MSSISENSKIKIRKIPFNVIFIGLIFALRSSFIFPVQNWALISLITIWDLFALLLSGIFICFLYFRKDTKNPIFFILICWFLVPWILVASMSILYGLIARSDLRNFFLIFSILLVIILLVIIISWKFFHEQIINYIDSLNLDITKRISPDRLFRRLVIVIGILAALPIMSPLLSLMVMVMIFSFYTESTIITGFFIVAVSFWLSFLLVINETTHKMGTAMLNKIQNIIGTIRINPEIIFTGCFTFLIIFAFLTPRLMNNSIQYKYEGPQEVIDSYLDLEISKYFTGIQGIIIDTCSGFGSFQLAPNFLGASERISYINSILSSDYKAETSIKITAYKKNGLSGDEILQLVQYEFQYEYGYWNNSLHVLEDEHMGLITELSWVEDRIYLVQESVSMDNTVGSDMQFFQIIAYLPVNNSILTILVGHTVGCYD
ncbi:MAG: hypothetical protein ACFFB5_10650 [Promethearchaeota archaeon]